MSPAVKDKLKAFFVHLGISLCIAVGCLLFIYLGLYPAPLDKATGILHIFLLMMGIDVVLGPLLTLLVFKKGKKTLVFDLTVIALLQFGALVYGMYHIYEGRPVWVVYNVDRFDLVRANEVDDRHLDQAEPQFRKPSLFGVRYVASVIPDAVEAKTTIMMEEIGSGVAPSQRPELYRDLSAVQASIQSRSLPLSDLDKFNDKQKVVAILAKYPIANAYLPLKANKQDLTVLVDKDKAQVVGLVDLNPWQ